METSIRLMTAAIADILQDSEPSIYLYGSVTMDDFRPGWSDIDLLVLTRKPITAAQAQQLLPLRQMLPLQHPDASFARFFEGGMLSLDAFTKGYPDIVVYWGTSGQRLTDHHHFDSFSLWELHHCSQLLHGPEIRHTLPLPTPSDMHSDVAHHLRTVLDHGHGSVSLYTFGWLLDISRGLYTLQNDSVISKTAAGEWALEHHLCPEESALRLALAVRRDPTLINDAAVRRQAEALTPAIQGYAAILRKALDKRGIAIPE